MNRFMKYRYLILRRFVQLSILVLFWGANKFGWDVLVGNLSSAKVFDLFYLSDPFAVLQILATGSIITMDIFIGALIIFIFYSLVVGRSFCSWVCPINIITDSAAWLRNENKSSKNSQVLNIQKSTRYYIIILALILSAVLGVAAYEVINPIGITIRGVVFGFGMGGFILLGIFLFDILVLKHGFCGYLCPIGGFYSFISRFRILKIYLDNDKCTSCMDCKKVCPEVQVLGIVGKESGSILQGACTNCGRCIEVCDDKALKFTLKLK